MAPKKQAQKMSLGDFLGDQSLGSWADEMEDQPLPADSRTGYGGERRAFSSAGGFGGDRASSYAERGFAQREQLPLPTKPPYTAHLGNLPFDATVTDIEGFFAQCEVTNVRIVEDKIERKPKGFGYVEFGSLDGLKRALDLNGSQLTGRNVRISVADPPKDRPEARELNDWTRKGPLPDLPGQQRRSSDRGNNPRGGGGYEAPDMERGGSRRGGNFEGDGKVRDFGNWERKGPLSPLPAAAPTGRDAPREGRPRVNEGPREGTRERRNSPSWGEGRSQDGSRPPPRNDSFRGKPPIERQPTAAEKDTQWRVGMRPDAPAQSSTPTPDPSVPSSPAAQAPAAKERPKLNLAKRTVSEAVPAESASAGGDAKASPFGAARPINTAAREKEVEEKRRQARVEAEEKVKEEKKAKEEAAKAAAAEKAEKAEAEQKAKAEEEETKANGEEAPAENVYKILSRGEGDKAEKENGNDSKADANGDEKPAPPRGPRRDREPPRGPKSNQGSWRRKPSTPGSPATPTAEGGSVDDDGWSTVPAKTRGARRGGFQTSRGTSS